MRSACPGTQQATANERGIKGTKASWNLQHASFSLFILLIHVSCWGLRQSPQTPTRPSGQAAWAGRMDGLHHEEVLTQTAESSESAGSLCLPNLGWALGTHNAWGCWISSSCH